MKAIFEKLTPTEEGATIILKKKCSKEEIKSLVRESAEFYGEELEVKLPEVAAPTKEDDHYFNLATSITMNLVSMLRKERELGRNEGIDMVTAQTKDEISQAEKDRAALVERHANLYTGNAGVMVGMSGMGRDGKD